VFSDILQTLLNYDVEHSEGAGVKRSVRMFLYSLVRLNEPERVIEIGVSLGFATEWLAAAIHDNGHGELISVDDWSGDHGGKAHSKRPALHRMKDLGLAECVTFVGSDSVEWLKTQKDGSADIVWVDGDHSYEGASGDIREAWRVTRDMVAVHDTENASCGENVSKAICETGLPGVWMRGARGIWVTNKHRGNI
jgi:predicted O-methyltransferase YrrM